MIKYIAILLLLVGTSLAAENDFTDPMTILDSKGLLVISDGSSLYRFNNDGTFYSHPRGMSGRVLRGTWTQTDKSAAILTANAKHSWQNVSSAIDDYRQITFSIYHGKLRPSDQRTIGEAGYEHIFDCYFIISELKKIPKPENAQQAGPGYPPQGVGSPDP